MNYQEYVQNAQRAVQLVEAGQYEQAQELLRTLLNSEIADRDKAMMCLNLAVVCDKLGQTTEALRWYDHGIAYERRHGQSFVTESKAIYLAEHGQAQESLVIYETLLAQDSLNEATKVRIRKNIHRLKQRSSG